MVHVVMFGVPEDRKTKKANAHVLQSECREQRMREIAIRVSILLARNHPVVVGGSLDSGIGPIQES